MLHEQGDHPVKDSKGETVIEEGTFRQSPGTGFMAADELANVLGLISSGSDHDDDVAFFLAVLEGKRATLDYRSYMATVPRIMVSLLPTTARARELDT